MRRAATSADPGEFRIEEESLGPSARLLIVHGDADLYSAPELRERVRRAIDTGVTTIVVDINRVVFLDSAALHVFFKLARQRGARSLALVMEPHAAVSRTLDIVGMRDAVRVVASLDDLDRNNTG